MKILQVRLKNLNSLRGHWCIDFTQKEYADQGIFAITGPTGAGKSTILDAICLALYASTPRLGKITASSNEILSRNTADCFAEILFENQRGQFRCHWSQKKARASAQGKLQNPKHEIARADGTILESYVSKTPVVVEQLTGLNFEQFTRSALLAQGSFAAFLQASAPDRAPLLEQITGTQVYSDISIAVQQRFSKEKQAFDELLLQQSLLPVFSLEERSEMEERLFGLRLALSELHNTAEVTREGLQWQIAWCATNEKFSAHHQDQLMHAEAEARFAPLAHTLQRALLAKELRESFLKLENLKSNFSEKTTQLNMAKTNLVTTEGQAQTLQVNWQNAEQQYLNSKAKEASLQAEASQFSKIQNKLLEVEKQLAESIRRKENIEKEIRKVTESVVLKEHELGSLKVLQERLASYLAENIKAEEAATQLAAFHQQQQYIEKLQTERSLLAETCTKASTQQSELEQLLLSHSNRLQHFETAEQNLLQEKTLLQQQIHTRKELFPAGGPQKELLRLQELGFSWSHILDSSKMLLQLSQQKAQEEEKIRTQQAAISHLSQRLLPEIAERIENAQRKKQDASIQRDLAEKVAHFLNERQLLSPTKPCPLCGALEHPFATESVSDANQLLNFAAEANKQLQMCEQELEGAKEKRAKLQQEQIEAERSLNVAQEQTQTMHQRFLEKQQHVEAFLAQLSHLSLSSDPLLPTELEQTQDTWLTMVERASRELGILELSKKSAQNNVDLLIQDENRMHELENMLRETGEKAKHASNTAKKISTDIAVVSQKLQSIQEQIAGVLKEHEVASSALDHSLQAFELTGSTNVSAQCESFANRIENRNEIRIENLRVWAQLFTQNKSALAINKDNQQQLCTQTKELNARGAVLQASLQEIHDSVLLLHNEKVKLNLEAETLFATRNVLREWVEAKEILDIRDKFKEECQIALSQALGKTRQLQVNISQWEQETATLENQLMEMNADFLDLLQAKGFATEEQFRAAVLHDAQLQEIAQQKATLTNRALALQTQCEFLTAERNKLARQGAALNYLEHAESGQLESTLSEEILQQKLQACNEEITKAGESIGALEEQLKQNATTTEKSILLGETISKRKVVLTKWDNLNKLIGSADGKKFRNFAQGLTFENMIYHANKVLAQMSDRYELEQSKETSLELCVLDHYHAGEIRTTKNLSGGEGFLVSLALSLGLSQLSSKNVNVDSLFLDEGFGTLDDEALEVALQCLAGLQRTGKLIGVISHVSGLKERIPLQLRVEPTLPGQSKITGVGVSSGKFASE